MNKLSWPQCGIRFTQRLELYVTSACYFDRLELHRYNRCVIGGDFNAKMDLDVLQPIQPAATLVIED